jgi:GNAT superfamily N-acetyltransferase
MPPIALRKARVEDAAAMPSLEQSAGELFRTLPDLAWLAGRDNLEEARYRELVAGGWCWVAGDSQDGVCAFLAAEPLEEELHIWELAVALDRQRLGIGRTLIQAAITAATRHGFRAVTLTTFADVAWNAPFYERVGFRRLASTELGPRLHAVLRREAEAGLPSDRRCAMRLALPVREQA